MADKMVLYLANRIKAHGTFQNLIRFYNNKMNIKK